MLMNKTIKQAERYEAPESMVITIAVQKVIALSPNEYNPGGYVPDMEEGGNI